MLLRASACIEERVERERTAQDVGMVAEIRERQALEYQTESSWEQALSAWRMLEAVHELREDSNGLDDAGDAVRRIDLALAEIRRSDATLVP